MIKYFRACIAVPVIAFFSHSCTTTLYTSNAVNAPLLTQKGQIKVNATNSDMQFAVAAGNHLGIMANGYFQSHKSSNNYQHRGGLLELGAGYYTQRKEHMVFEAYAGGGMGRVYKQEMVKSPDNNSDYLGSFTANGAKLFIQPGVGFTSAAFDLALTQRISMVKYTRFTSNNLSQEYLKNDYLENITEPMYVFVEPAITARLGFRFIKLQAQYGLTLNMSPNIKHPSNFASIGLVVDIK